MSAASAILLAGLLVGLWATAHAPSSDMLLRAIPAPLLRFLNHTEEPPKTIPRRVHLFRGAPEDVQEEAMRIGRAGADDRSV